MGRWMHARGAAFLPFVWGGCSICYSSLPTASFYLLRNFVARCRYVLCARLCPAPFTHVLPPIPHAVMLFITIVIVS
jgi:hypothetical protein